MVTMQVIKVLSTLLVFTGVICAFKYDELPNNDVEEMRDQGEIKGMTSPASHLDIVTDNGQTGAERTNASSSETECPNKRRRRIHEYRCPETFCQHVSYRCDIRCRGQETGVDCELYNCEGTYHCSSPKKYNISISQVCDGVSQCPDSNDDESTCTRPCQPFCMCIGLTVNYSHLTATRVSFENISIIVKNNDLHCLRFLQLSFVSYLVITDLSTLADYFITGLYNLYYLDLSNNGISHLTDNVFSGLSGLERLTLWNNHIQILPDNLFNSLSKLNELDLSNNQINVLTDNVFSGLSGLRFLYLSDNQIKVLPNTLFSGLSELRDLYLSNNQIKVLPDDIFSGLSDLERLFLQHNQIRFLPDNVFSGLSNLVQLDISNNKIKTLPDDVFNYKTSALVYLDIQNNQLFSLPQLPFSLQFFDIKNNSLINLPVGTFLNNDKLSMLNIIGNKLKVYENMFEGLDNLLLLLTDTPFLCCAKPKSVTDDKCLSKSTFLLDCWFTPDSCKSKDDAISSCHALIGSNILRVFLWVIGVCAVAGNFAVILYRLFINRSNITQSYSLFIINLGISDLLMGIYLVMIGVVDVYYYGVYAWNEQNWRKSILCTTAGVLSSISSEMSTFLILLVTIDRLIVIMFPMARYHKRNISAKQASIISGFLWLVSIAIAVIPSIYMPSYFKGEFYSQSGVCLALPLTTVDQPGAEYSFAVFVGLNSFIFFVIVICQSCIFVSMKKRSSHIASSQTRQRDIGVAKSLFFVVATDFFCWFPIGVMGVATKYFGVEIPPDVYAWVMVFVLPINAAVNPFLYTVTEIWRKRQRAQIQMDINMKSITPASPQCRD